MLYPDPNAVRSANLIPEDPLVSAKYLAAPEKARKEVDSAREARQKGDCTEAVKHGKKATEIAPDFAIAYFETGSCQLELGKVDDARKSFQTSIEKDPKFLYGYIGLARAEKQQKKWNDAAQALGQANKAQPDRAEPFYELALLQLETGHPDKAELAARTALGKNHQYVPDLPFLLARIYVLEKKDEDAAKLLKEIADKNPNSELGQRAKRSLKLLEKANTVKK
jgi:tetratricopeptide (TPR) repeat protein